MDNIIFTLEDVRAIRKVSVNINDFEIYAREAQITFLEKVIGAKLYNALITGLNEVVVPDRITKLFEGELYTNQYDINFRGVKPYLCYVWLYLYSLESSVAVTPTGSRVFKDEEAAYNEQLVSIKQAQTNYLSSAEAYENNILDYLRFKTDIYPEFSESKQIEVAEKSNNTFKTFGKSYTPPNKIW